MIQSSVYVYQVIQEVYASLYRTFKKIKLTALHKNSY